MLPISQLSGIISQSGTQVVIAPGTPVTTLQVRATGAGTFPYSATVLPLEGQVPTGSTLQCVEDTSLRACILSTHSDGSASVVVVSGTTTVSLNQTKTLSLQTATIVGETNLNASRISSLLTDISLNFGSPYGTATISDFSSPERIWWATPTTICARYRIQPPTLSGTQLEAVIDVHAYASSTNALVEIVVENCKMNTASPSAPSAASYTSAVLTINGNTITTVNGNGAPEGYHAPFRSWYSSSWLQGDPGLRITQLYTDLQKHPLLFKCDQTSTADLSTYANDAYTPWTGGRQRSSGMGAGGDHGSIGPLPLWEAQALQSGDSRVWNAVEVSALACLGFVVNYRDTATGIPPTFTQLKAVPGSGYSGAWQGQNWPSNGTDALGWEVAHHPAAGLMAFIARPSPVFIELAEKVAVWNGTWSIYVGDGTTTPCGVFGAPYQVRGRAWCTRSLAHAIFLTPDASVWKTPAKTSLSDNITYQDVWRTDSKFSLGVMCDDRPSAPTDNTAYAGFQTAVWEHHYYATEIHKVASLGLLTGPSQTALNTLADWAVLQTVRWVNEQSNGSWRYIAYQTTIGHDATTIASDSTWGAQITWAHTDTPPSTTGGWFSFANYYPGTFSAYIANPTAGAYYPSYFWAAFQAAMERRVTGYQTAWQTVNNSVTSLATWRQGFGGDPRWGSLTRVIPPTPIATGFSTLSTAAGSITNDIWTPGVDSNGTVTAASWNTIPINRWTTVAGTNISSVEPAILAAIPAWRDYGVEGWTGVTDDWVGYAFDLNGCRAWSICGGGHAGSSNNGIYRFDCYNMKWSVEHLPSDPTNWSNDYKASGTRGYSFTNNSYGPGGAGDPKDSVLLRTQQVAAGTSQVINGVMEDELITDREPCARHTYSTCNYHADTNSLSMFCRRLWLYSIDQAKWVYRRTINDVVGGGGWGGADNFATYDEVSKQLLYGSIDGGDYKSLGYDLAGNRWVGWGNPWAIYQAADCRVGRNLAGLSVPVSDNAGVYPGKYWLYNLDTRSTITSGNVQFAGGLSASEFMHQSYYYDGAALAYVASQNFYVVATLRNDGGMGLYKLDPTTSPWTLSSWTFGGTQPAMHPNLCRKIIYYPALDALVLYGSYNGNAAIYRF